MQQQMVINNLESKIISLSSGVKLLNTSLPKETFNQVRALLPQLNAKHKKLCVVCNAIEGGRLSYLISLGDGLFDAGGVSADNRDAEVPKAQDRPVVVDLALVMENFKQKLQASGGGNKQIIQGNCLGESELLFNQLVKQLIIDKISDL